MVEGIKDVQGVFGTVNQVGVLTGNIEESVRIWSRTLGVGPWYRAIAQEEDTIMYRGNETRIRLDIALGYAGPVQIELIEVKGKERNIYVEHLEKHGEGVHHLGFFVYGLEKKAAALDAAGIRVLQSGAVKSKGGAITRYAYYDTVPLCGTVLELIETKLAGIPLKMTRFMTGIGALTGDVARMKP